MCLHRAGLTIGSPKSLAYWLRGFILGFGSYTAIQICICSFFHRSWNSFFNFLEIPGGGYSPLPLSCPDYATDTGIPQNIFNKLLYFTILAVPPDASSQRQ